LGLNLLIREAVSIIKEYFSVPTWGDKSYRLNPTHEEIVVPLMKEFINSYKDSGT
jgi:prolyl-tRNA synthetase